MKPFEGKRALILGVANERSLAWGIAQVLHQGGARLAFTYLGEALKRRVEPLAQSVNAELIEACDVSYDDQINALFGKVREKWDGLDILVHSLAYANRDDLEGRFVDTSREGFRIAMDISAYSLVAVAKQAESLMQNNGGSILTLSYYGAEKVVPNYNVMGVAKAALEASVRYLAWDLGPKKIRVNAISAGPVKTLAAAGIRNFRTMLSAAEEKTPLKENINAQDVGELGAFLCGPGGVHITGTTMYVDSGAHIMA
ncbi:MAG TPA: enoyl-[acyl-carrier-protein] reductase FabI [Bdellovibrionales bacterium]|nr:enoyl-[acyl-carrier-protein] reductase FabI [Bdellovibrionales bacterium]HCM41144.1 enoyl-[acyl-carrier-protein] reductase FabI [Bdellovibrionales bacterium]